MLAASLFVKHFMKPIRIYVYFSAVICIDIYLSLNI